MNKISAYFRDSYRELVDKVTWPNWQQLQQTTMIVLGATIVITLIVAAMDFLLIGKIGSTETGILNYFYKIF
ncbi:MAG: preprotein translocase subunit SecE [Dinghuibacter sp.]|nr:preprotein translocase subunit SecE [Dinghuibacter sp.]